MVVSLNDLLNFLESLIFKLLLQHLLNFCCTDGRRQAKNLHSSTFLDELSLYPKTLFCYLLSAVVTDLLVPCFFASFLQVTLDFEATDRFYLLLFADHQQAAYVL